MSENDITTSETSNEREIDSYDVRTKSSGLALQTVREINLAHANETTSDDIKTDTSNDSQMKSFKTVEPKNVGELTDDERAIIIANAKNGVEQPNFDVRFFNNGKFRIVRKKQKPQTISEKVVKTQEIPVNDKKAYYTDNQLLFEHIIELNAKVDRLMSKHKKLKRKYQTLQNDIYIDDDELETVKPTTNLEPVIEQISEPTPTSIVQEPASTPIVQNVQQMTTTPIRQNWRSQLRYL